MDLHDYLCSHGVKPIDEETLAESMPRMSNQTLGTNDDIQQRSFHVDRSGSGQTINDKEIDHFLNNSKKIVEAKEDYFKQRLEANIHNLSILIKK